MRKRPFVPRFLWLTLVLLWPILDQRSAARAAEHDPKIEPRLYRDKIEPRWFDNGNKFWYRVDLPNSGREFILVDALHGTRSPAFDHQRVADQLNTVLKEHFTRDRLPVDSLEFSSDGKKLFLKAKEHRWKLDLEAYQLDEEHDQAPDATEKPPPNPRRRERRTPPKESASPDGKWELLVRGDNLFLRNKQSSNERALTSDANPNDSYVRDAQRERFVEMEYDAAPPESPRPEVSWAPNSRYFVAMRTRSGGTRVIYLIESSPADQLQPKLQSYPYLKPGDEIPVRKPHLFDASTAAEIPLDDSLFARPWSISDLRWSADSSRFTFLYNQRGHQALRILSIASANGAVQPIIDERSQTFIDYSGKFFAEYLDPAAEIIWMSERDGWNHLYLYDSQSGRVKNQITHGNWVVRGVDYVDRDRRQIWFRAGGIRPGQDPYYVHYCRVNFDGSHLVLLTEGDGTHSAQFSPDRRFLVDTWSRVDLPPRSELRRSDDGALICPLEEADATELLASGWRPPQRFSAKGRDDATDIYGIVHWPRPLDPSKKYPIIESIYAGPQDSYVPKAFRPAYPQEKLSARGFVVVQIDGMGTANRSKTFHDVCWKNIGDAGFPDRIRWIQAAAAQFPVMDLARVGIYGTSAGGQNALRGLLAHGDFYRAGVADSGCHDNRMDKIWWNEQWMGWPVGPQYDEQSNVTQAHRLQGKLLLMEGELDKNVDPASTLQVVNALIKANKDFELLIVPGAGHGVLRLPYAWRRLEDFFARTLLNASSTTEKHSLSSSASNP